MMSVIPAGVDAPALHVRAVILPGGERRDLYVAGGRVSYEKVPDAVMLGTGYVVPGLVDLHCHIGLGPDGEVDQRASEEQASLDRDNGTLLMRDAGSPADTRWMDDRPDMPRMIRAGRHIARPKRYLRNYAVEIEPAQLVDEVRTQAARGDGWVKLVGDWIDREVGDLTPLWPTDVLVAAIDAAHDAGARVTAHTFSEDAVEQLVDAGIDCIEHGTGLRTPVIEKMAARGVGLVPTRLQVENFPTYARIGRARYPRYAEHMLSLYETADATIAAAHEAGVPVFTGTDSGGVLPHGLLAAEVVALVEKTGLAPVDALAAASWRARAWLGRPAELHDGVPADFVLYDDDPRVDPHVLTAPKRIVLRGRVVR